MLSYRKGESLNDGIDGPEKKKTFSKLARRNLREGGWGGEVCGGDLSQHHEKIAFRSQTTTPTKGKELSKEKKKVASCL